MFANSSADAKLSSAIASSLSSFNVDDVAASGVCISVAIVPLPDDDVDEDDDDDDVDVEDVTDGSVANDCKNWIGNILNLASSTEIRSSKRWKLRILFSSWLWHNDVYTEKPNDVTHNI